MRKISILVIILLLCLSGISRNWMSVTSQTPVPATVKLVSSDIDHSQVQFCLKGFYLKEVMTPQGPASVIELKNSAPIQEQGAPDLPLMAAALVIPDQSGMETRILSVSYKDFENIDIAPSKGVILRTTDPATVPFRFGPAYQEDRFFPGKVTDTRDPYIIRDVRGQTLLFYPFQYNPVKKTLRVFYDVTVELAVTNSEGINPVMRPVKEKKISRDFADLYQRQFLNFGSVRYTPLGEYGNVLVICYNAFLDAIKPWADWKTAEGYHTEVVSKDSVGTSSSQIKAYILNYYNTKGLTHVLLVGDGPQIPTNNGGGLGGPSDNAYGYLVGNDHFADVFVGRFSAENVTQVQTQVQRTLEYEQNPQFPTNDWFTSVIGIASDQGPGDQGEFDYQHIRNQQTQLMAYTYTWNPEFFDGSQGGNDAPGNPNPPMIVASVDSGASLIIYCGHGSQQSWGTSGFSNASVAQLENYGKWPFIWSVACVNGDFVSGTCFAEAWLRATKNNQPTGAIAFLGSTINQSWNSPMAGQDAMTDILTENYPNNIKRTFAGLSINGCMKMIDLYGADGSNMADTWTIFGDPTVAVRTSLPLPLTVSHDTLLYVGDSLLVVSCADSGARITLSVADTILLTEILQDSVTTLHFPALANAGDTIHLVVTAYNRIPYIGSIVVQPLIPVVAGFFGDPTRVVPGNFVAFTDTSSGTARNWHWYFPGGTPDTSVEKNPVVMYNTRGAFNVTLIVGNGNMYDTLTRIEYITVEYATGTGDHSGSSGITVLPNPSDGNFVVEIRITGTDVAGLFITDLKGTRVYSREEVEIRDLWSGRIDLGSLPKGMYFLRVKGSKTNEVQKIVIR